MNPKLLNRSSRNDAAGVDERKVLIVASTRSHRPRRRTATYWSSTTTDSERSSGDTNPDNVFHLNHKIVP